MDRAARTGGASQIFVMKHHDVAVTAQLTIHFDHISVRFDRFGESQAGILRISARGAPMRYFL